LKKHLIKIKVESEKIMLLKTLRHIALDMLKQEKTLKNGIKCKRLKACADEDYLEKVVFAKF